MGYDLGRAAVACLSVLAVVFAASLFPAAGLGTFPEGVSAGGGGDAAGGTGGPPGGTGANGSTASPTPATATQTTTAGEETTTEGGETTSATETETRTQTRTETETATENAEEDDGASAGDYDDPETGGGTGVVGLVLFAFVGVPVALGGLLAMGMMLGVAEARRSGPNGGLVLDIAGRSIDVGGTLQGVSQTTMGMVLGLSSASGRMLTGLGNVASGLAGGVSSLGTGGTSAIAAIPKAMGRGLLTVGSGLGGAASSAPSGFGSLLSGLGSFSLGWSGGSSPTRDARMDGVSGGDGGDGGDGGYRPPQSVEEAWERFARDLPVRNPRARTPGEYARVAAARGMPAEAVSRLTQVFREVRYGGRESDDRRFDRARGAYERIRGDNEEDDS